MRDGLLQRVFVPPATQLTEQTHRWLGASGLFFAVVGTGSSLPETHVLEGNLVALVRGPPPVGDGRDGAAVHADPSFGRSFGRRLPEDLLQAIAVTDDGPEGVVRGWDGALGRILSALESDLSKVDRSSRR
jgi:hypothetical protein